MKTAPSVTVYLIMAGNEDWTLRNRTDAYVELLKLGGAIRTLAVEDAFRKVPRHRFVDRFFVPNKEFSSQSGYREILSDPATPTAEHLDLIYSREALITRLDPNGMPCSSTSMPGLVADMLESLRLEPGHKVLEIGAGTGYNAALIAEIVGDHSNVVTVDIQEDVVEQTGRLLRDAGYPEIKVIARDGYFGVSDEAPFDRIVATVGLFDVSQHWVEQLAAKGEMLLPLYQGGACPLVRVVKQDDRLIGRVVGGSGFMPIQGEMVPEESARFRVPRSLLKGELPAQDGPDSSVQKRPGWNLSKGMGARWDVWFFMTASDQRVSLLAVPGGDDGSTWTDWTFGISEGSARVIVGTDELVLVGSAEPLLERLEHLYDTWDSAGRPTASDYDIEFITKGKFSPEPGALAIERKYNWQILRLPKAPLGEET